MINMLPLVPPKEDFFYSIFEGPILSKPFDHRLGNDILRYQIQQGD